MRGDRPRKDYLLQNWEGFTPHARGSTRTVQRPREFLLVYPACAGIDPWTFSSPYFTLCLPRMRGDRPRPFGLSASCATFTPHARGSTLLEKQFLSHEVVYPACAGIDLCGKDFLDIFLRLPRMRGDRPQTETTVPSQSQFTPHARGSTYRKFVHLSTFSVYPACAGIDLYVIHSPSIIICLPRMRGDRPKIPILFNEATGFTPHARGSTCMECRSRRTGPVYPACAGIDPVSCFGREVNSRLPRMRGDRPLLMYFFPDFIMFTPHARGSTLRDEKAQELGLVYPACAGIDLPSEGFCCELCCLPRMRGDRPLPSDKRENAEEFTPHARGSTSSVTMSP